MTFVSKYSFTGKLFVLLLLCSACIAPVMAGTMATSGTRIIEDGVHLVKFEDSPTELDYNYYHVALPETVVVDGNQFYWVRIGSVVSEKITTSWWSLFASATLLLLTGFFLVYCWYLIFKRYFPLHYTTLMSTANSVDRRSLVKALVIFFVPFYCIFGLTVLDNSVVDSISEIISDMVYADFADLKASDGTILLMVDKLHPEDNVLFMKSGGNLTTLTHLSSSGNIIPTHGVNAI